LLRRKFSLSVIFLTTQKKAKEEKQERRPFSRDTDLQVNRFDESRKKAAIKSSQLLDDRFGRGNAKYL
jgi:hypothetical protein